MGRFTNVKLQFVLLCTLLIQVNVTAQLGIYDFTGTTSCSTENTSVDSQPPGGMFSDFSRTNVECIAQTNAYRSRRWCTNCSTPDLNEYLEYSFTAGPNSAFTLTSLDFVDIAQQKLANTLRVALSVDGFFTTSQFTDIVKTSTASTSQNWDFVDIYLAAHQTVTFRFYIYGTANVAFGNSPTPISAYTVDDVKLQGSILPVSLAHFRAQNDTKGIVLAFATSTEANNAYFDIEHSVDGRFYKAIGRLDGHGTSYERNDYHFTDEKPSAGLNYYRLKQVDYDGSFEYFGPRQVLFNNEKNEISIYPTLVNDQLTISSEIRGDGVPVNYEVHDTRGEIVLQGQLSESGSASSLFVAFLPAGSYWFRWVYNGQQGVLPFVKQ